jgi:ribonuclease P/MRP protein subunit POP1
MIGNKAWLPTHIWHAKRFHMINIWSHRLPLTPTLKSFRPAYRASRRKCAVHDASYYGVLELDSDVGLERVTAGRYAGERYVSGGVAHLGLQIAKQISCSITSTSTLWGLSGLSK